MLRCVATFTRGDNVRSMRLIITSMMMIFNSIVLAVATLHTAGWRKFARLYGIPNGRLCIDSIPVLFSIPFRCFSMRRFVGIGFAALRPLQLAMLASVVSPTSQLAGCVAVIKRLFSVFRSDIFSMRGVRTGLTTSLMAARSAVSSVIFGHWLFFATLRTGF